MSLILNPGTGHVPDATLDNAIENMQRFATDVITAHGYKGATSVAKDPLGQVSEQLKGGRWEFVMTCEVSTPGAPLEEWVVNMPGLPLEQVRYLGPPQNPFEFTRLYIDGLSWLWKFGVNACVPRKQT